MNSHGDNSFLGSAGQGVVIWGVTGLIKIDTGASQGKGKTNKKDKLRNFHMNTGLLRIIIK